MTKKGIILTVILIILLSTIVVLVTLRHKEVKKDILQNLASDLNSEQNDEFAFNITEVNGLNLEKLKEHGLPIIIQIGSSTNDICAEMISNLESLNRKLRGKAIIKYLDTDKYSELWNEPLITLDDDVIQLLINNDGTPYNTNASEALGYKFIKNENGMHVYTLHDGDLTLDNIEEILNNMLVK